MSDFVNNILEQIKSIKNSTVYKRLNVKSRSPGEQQQFNRMRNDIKILQNRLSAYASESRPATPVHIPEHKIHRLPPRRRHNTHRVVSADVIPPVVPKVPVNPLLAKVTDKVEGLPNNHIIASSYTPAPLFEPDSDSLDDFLNN